VRRSQSAPGWCVAEFAVASLAGRRRRHSEGSGAKVATPWLDAAGAIPERNDGHTCRSLEISAFTVDETSSGAATRSASTIFLIAFLAFLLNFPVLEHYARRFSLG
jgi:hypothetical protein